ncbi:hypothetical protein [Clostridium guangxiense]|nr:hypothetical protein [Clostridium guangxiense]
MKRYIVGEKVAWIDFEFNYEGDKFIDFEEFSFMWYYEFFEI